MHSQNSRRGLSVLFSLLLPFIPFLAHPFEFIAPEPRPEKYLVLNPDWVFMQSDTDNWKPKYLIKYRMQGEPTVFIDDAEVSEDDIGHGTIALGLAGRGKTTLMLSNRVKRFGVGHVVVVCPTNKLAYELRKKYQGVTAITFHNFFALTIDDDLSQHYKPYLDRKNKDGLLNRETVKAVHFEELPMLSRRKLERVWKFVMEQEQNLNCQMWSHIECTATGDPNQLPPIADQNDALKRLTPKETIKLLTSRTFFPHPIVLTRNRRMEHDTPENQEKFLAFERDLEQAGDTHDEAVALIRKHFSHAILEAVGDIQERDITRAVSYRNETSVFVNEKLVPSFPSILEKVQNGNPNSTRTLANNLTYSTGMELVCKKGYIAKVMKSSAETDEMIVTRGSGERKLKLHRNYTYNIRLDPKDQHNFVLLDGDIKVTVPHDVIVSHFWLPYCNTVHSAQGMSIEEPFVIMDMHLKWVTKHWVYTAASRATRREHIHFLDQSLYNTCPDREARTVAAKIVEQCKSAERAKSWNVECDDYITVQWILNTFKWTRGVCSECGAHMSFEANFDNKLSVDRIQNSLPHNKINCRLLCKAPCQTASAKKK